MFTSLRVENLRSLRHLELPKLGRITLLTGRNAAGKTTVLEGLWLLASPGRPGNALRLNGFRGLNVVEVREGQGEPPWASLFSDYDASQRITVSARSRFQGQERTETVVVHEVESQRASTEDRRSANGSASTAAMGMELAMTVDGIPEFDARYRLVFGPEEAKVQPQPPPLPKNTVFLHARTDESVEVLGQRFSGLVAQGRERTIVEAIRLIEPRVEGLRLLTSGGTAIVHVDVGGPHLIALPLMGGGLWRLFGIVVDLLYCRRDGLLLLDEAEYGIHYSVLPKLWRLVDELSSEHHVQVVATTHSRECISAAFEAQEGKLVKAGDDFVFMRLRNDADGAEAVMYDPQTLEAALEGDIEVR